MSLKSMAFITPDIGFQFTVCQLLGKESSYGYLKKINEKYCINHGMIHRKGDGTAGVASRQTPRFTRLYRRKMGLWQRILNYAASVLLTIFLHKQEDSLSRLCGINIGDCSTQDTFIFLCHRPIFLL